MRKRWLILIGAASLLVAAGTAFALSASVMSPSPRAAFPCALTYVAGADGTSSCWATHTGVQGATGCSESQIESQSSGCGSSVFKHVTRDLTISTRGTTIDHEWISGCIAIDASNVTIEDSLIASQDLCSGGGGGSAAGTVNDGNSGSPPTGIAITDTTIDAENPDFTDEALSGWNITCTRCNVTGGKDLFVAIGSDQLNESYLHGLNPNSGKDHEQSVMADTASHDSVRHSYITGNNGDGHGNAAISIQSDYGSSNYIAVTNSYIFGPTNTEANIEVDCGYKRVSDTHLVFQNDALDSATAYKGAFSGYMSTAHGGVWAGWGNSGNVWSGNYQAKSPSQSIAAPGGC